MKNTKKIKSLSLLGQKLWAFSKTDQSLILRTERNKWKPLSLSSCNFFFKVSRALILMIHQALYLKSRKIVIFQTFDHCENSLACSNFTKYLKIRWSKMKTCQLSGTIEMTFSKKIHWNWVNVLSPTLLESSIFSKHLEAIHW